MHFIGLLQVSTVMSNTERCLHKCKTSLQSKFAHISSREQDGWDSLVFPFYQRSFCYALGTKLEDFCILPMFSVRPIPNIRPNIRQKSAEYSAKLADRPIPKKRRNFAFFVHFSHNFSIFFLVDISIIRTFLQKY